MFLQPATRLVIKLHPEVLTTSYLFYLHVCVTATDLIFFVFCFVTQVKANEVGGACGTHGRGEKSVQGFGGKARSKETTWKTKA
jgi:hypothetical protein